ncbi:MAG: ABC transporter ATP-binding protein [Clostridium sp.]
MLELVNLKKQYGDFTAVNNISFKVNEGEVFGLLGPNGAGKSTTVSMISTVLDSTEGEIFINGKSIRKNPSHGKSVMGIVPQDLALYENLSVRDNLDFFGSLYGLKGKELKNRINEVLKIILLEEKENQDVSKLSGGMKRRVNIGVALMNNPKLLILDEPTVGIDPQSRNHILETIKNLNKERNMTVIYTSHYMEEVEFLCERIAIVDHGQLIALGTKEELKNQINSCDSVTFTFNEGNEYNFLALKDMEGVEKVIVKENVCEILIRPEIVDLSNILNVLRKSGIKIKNLRYEEVNLESIFLQMTGKTLRE